MRIVAVLLCALLLAGCWDYRGMDQIDVVSGVALDKDEQTGQYQMLFEIVDVSAASGDAGMESIYVESEGATYFEAIRNAKRRLVNNLYFGTMETLVVSHQLAQSEGVFSIIDGFLRDGEARETLNVVISQQETARELLQTKGLDFSGASLEINQILKKDQAITSSTRRTEIYAAYDMLVEPGKALVLPAMHLTDNNQEIVIEANGIAIFYGDRLAGYLPPEETKYYLIATNNARGGALSFASQPGGEENVSVEIKQCETKRSYDYDGEQVVFSLAVDIRANLIEERSAAGALRADKANLEEQAARAVKENLENVLQNAQARGIDFFGFGSTVYKDDPMLWNNLAGTWEDLFRSARFDIMVSVSIQNNGIIKG